MEQALLETLLTMVAWKMVFMSKVGSMKKGNEFSMIENWNLKHVFNEWKRNDEKRLYFRKLMNVDVHGSMIDDHVVVS